MKIKNKNWTLKFIILAVICLLAGAGGFNFAFAEDNSPSSTICAVYFTYLGCPNCAQVDPIVLTKWTKKYPELVVIEYMWKGGDWQDPNSQFFGEFTREYKTQAAVPQLVFDKKNIRLGGMDVPQGEKNIKALTSNPCPLINKTVFWEDLDLNELKAKPKIWANGRILIKKDNGWLFQWNGKSFSKDLIGEKNIDNELAKNLLFSDNVAKIIQGRKFEIVEPERAKFSGIVSSDSGVVPYAEFENAIKINPVRTEISNEINISEELITAQKNKPVEPSFADLPAGEAGATAGKEEIDLPIFGKIKTDGFSLPVLTAFLAITDGLTNPCGFFVIFFLLSALISLAGARKKMFLVGGIFIFFFALYYFLFMAVLLNIFMLGKEIAILTIIAGGICILTGLLNIKDYFLFQKGISLSLSKDKKLKFEQRVKNLSLTKSIPALIIGTTVIASTISLVAIACTFGIPLAYTKILISKSLPSLHYYLYLIFYNLIYILPMVTIVSVFAITLGKKIFGKKWIRILKLVSGFIILFLGSALVWNYVLLENVTFIFQIIIAAIVLSGLIIFTPRLLRIFRRY
jgi:hypothetical protein